MTRTREGIITEQIQTKMEKFYPKIRWTRRIALRTTKRIAQQGYTGRNTNGVENKSRKEDSYAKRRQRTSWYTDISLVLPCFFFNQCYLLVILRPRRQWVPKGLPGWLHQEFEKICRGLEEGYLVQGRQQKEMYQALRRDWEFWWKQFSRVWIPRERRLRSASEKETSEVLFIKRAKTYQSKSFCINFSSNSKSWWVYLLQIFLYQLLSIDSLYTFHLFVRGILPRLCTLFFSCCALGMHFSSILLTFGNTAAAMIRYLEFDALQLNNGGTSHLSNSDTCVLLSYFPFILHIYGQKARYIIFHYALHLKQTINFWSNDLIWLKPNKSVKIPASYSGMFLQTLISMSDHTVLGFRVIWAAGNSISVVQQMTVLEETATLQILPICPEANAHRIQCW